MTKIQTLVQKLTCFNHVEGPQQQIHHWLLNMASKNQVLKHINLKKKFVTDFCTLLKGCYCTNFKGISPSCQLNKLLYLDITLANLSIKH